MRRGKIILGDREYNGYPLFSRGVGGRGNDHQQMFSNLLLAVCGACCSSCASVASKKRAGSSILDYDKGVGSSDHRQHELLLVLILAQV